MSTTERTCNCELCQYFDKFDEHLSHVPEEHRPFFQELLDVHLELSQDHDVALAIIDGSWPTADEWIKDKRDRRARKEKEYEEKLNEQSEHFKNSEE